MTLCLVLPRGEMRAMRFFRPGNLSNDPPSLPCLREIRQPFFPRQVRPILKKGRVDAWASDKFSKQVLD